MTKQQIETLRNEVESMAAAGASTHPADAARATGIDLMLRRIGFAQQADEVQAEWSELVGLTAQSKPQGFDMAYPQPTRNRCSTRSHAARQRPVTKSASGHIPPAGARR